MTENGGAKSRSTKQKLGLPKEQSAVLATLTVSSFVVVLDSAVVFIPLPAILQQLHGTLDQGAWVLGAFILVFAVALLPCLRLAEFCDRRRLFLSGVAVFTLASLVCALAPSMQVLLGARAVQGLGAALLEVSVFTLITSVIQEDKRPRAFKVQGAAVGLGALLGPILGGVITTGLSWRYIFWLNVVVGIAVAVVAARTIPVSRTGDIGDRGIDVRGVLSGGLGLFLLLFGVTEGAVFGWDSVVIVASLAVSVVLLVGFVVNEVRARLPLVDVELFGYRRFAVGNFLRGVNEFASLGVFFALSHFLQAELGYSALVTGALLMAVILGALVTSPIAESLAERVDVRWLVMPGFLLLAGGIFWVAHVTSDTTWVFFLAPLVLTGAGFGAMEAPTTRATQRDVPDARSASGWGMSYTSYLLGIGLGVAVVSAVWQTVTVLNVQQALGRTDLNPALESRVWAYLATGGDSAGGAGMSDRVLGDAVAAAVNTALLTCVAMALIAAVVALFFTPGRKAAVR